MKSYYWLLATLLVLSFCVFNLFFDVVQNIEHVDKTDEQAVNYIDSIEKSSVLFRNKSSMENCYTYSNVGNGLFKT